jgi:hypothetical protein
MIRRALSDFMDAIQPRPLTAKERLKEEEQRFIKI